MRSALVRQLGQTMSHESSTVAGFSSLALTTAGDEWKSRMKGVGSIATCATASATSAPLRAVS